MRTLCGLLLAWVLPATMQIAGGQEPATRQMLVVVGAAGAAEFAPQFRNWATSWQQAGEAGGLRVQTIGLTPNADMPENPDRGDEEAEGEPASHREDPRDQLHAALKSAAETPLTELWLVLIGHGSFDGEQSKFNLVGPDVSAQELAQWLEPIRVEQALVVVNTASASSGFIPTLSGERRVVITATRAGSERNFARFGQYLAAAIDDVNSDLDKDGHSSLLEVFLLASQRTAEYYRDDARLVTEHALLDDNGDRRGTEADWFQGIRVVRKTRAGELVDGRFAHSLFLRSPPQENSWDPAMRARRDELEAQIERLVAEKNEFSPEDYYRQLESLFVPLARLHQERDRP
jgi:hypothetical protein